MSSPHPSSSQMGLTVLPSTSLDSALDHHRLQQAEDRMLLAARMGRDYAKKEAQEGWRRFDRAMEDSEWLGNGPAGGPFEFTQWDGIKKATSDAVHEGEHHVAVLKSQLAASPALSTPLSPWYASSSTANLQKGVGLHGRMARQYLTYMERDAENALDQVGMAAREQAEVVRRKLVKGLAGEGKQSSSACPSAVTAISSPPSPFHPTTRRPLFTPVNDVLSADNSHRIADGLLNAAGVAVDVGLGMAAGEWAEKRERKKKLERTARRTGQ
ncbi:hypothetical protein JCM6882_003938 [Rhodosporidiobolus microsporus]